METLEENVVNILNFVLGKDNHWLFGVIKYAFKEALGFYNICVKPANLVHEIAYYWLTESDSNQDYEISEAEGVSCEEVVPWVLIGVVDEEEVERCCLEPHENREALNIMKE